MHFRRYASSVTLLLLAGIGLCRVWHTSPLIAVLADEAEAPSLERLHAVTLVFGEKDDQPANWDGSVSISVGSIQRIAGYHFTAKSRIVNGNAWECATHPWPAFSHEMWPSERPQPRPNPVIPIGVTIYYEAPPSATISVSLKGRGEFSFKPDELPPINSIYPLHAQVEVRRSPVVQRLTDDEFDDDYPSIAADGDSFFVAWAAYKKEKGDQIFLRRLQNGKWSNRLTVTDAPGDLFGTAIAASRGKVTTIWSEHQGEDWHLKARDFDGSRFGVIQDVTSGTGKSLFHRAANDDRGNLAVAYQKSRNGRFDVYVRLREQGNWQPEIQLSNPSRDTRANAWDAAVAFDHQGGAWVAWDSYAEGNYQVYLRRVSGGRASAVIKVTNSTRYHAHPSIAVDSRDRIWLAWEEAPENWGKDYGFLFSGGTALYDSRTIKIGVYDHGRWLTTLTQPDSVAPYSFKRFVQTPRLVSASDGRVWLFLRPRILARHATNVWAAGGRWEACATYYSGGKWAPLIFIPESDGRNGGELQAAADTRGNVLTALVTDNQIWGGQGFGELPGNNDIVAARFAAGSPADVQLADLPPEPPAGGPSEPDEPRDVARLRNYEIHVEGKTYKIYRGDLHRHTEISIDGAGDGTLWDAYRYALDAADLDFLVVTDHQSGSQQYTWWRIQKAADMFHVPGFFTAIYGTERSVSYPNGHRNLLFAQRGVPILDISREEQQGKINSGSVLYPFLHKYHGISTPHSSHTSMGTDWRDNDPTVDPIVEIWEGSRTSAEHEGAPLAPSADHTELWAGNYRPLGFVWNAWAKGYKLGVQASSDHASTHLSYTCVLSQDLSRESLIDAMRHRHTYAATRNILLDYRMQAEGKTYIQGDELQSGTLPELRAHIVGTGRLKRVVVIRDNRYVYSHEPESNVYDLEYRDYSLAPGEHYYYVRVEQEDRNMAWSSPIWVNYQPGH